MLPDYSALIPADLMILAHFATSLATNWPEFAWRARKRSLWHGERALMPELSRPALGRHIPTSPIG